MNKIEIRNHFLSSGYEAKTFFIDGRPLYEYINQWLAENQELLQPITPTDDLAICWTDDYDFEEDSKFMRYILNQDHAITPILICPEDFDFSCIVIVADVIKKDNRVIWRRIGTVNHSNESFEKEKRSGLLYVDSYSKEDWAEELYHRRINYTFPYCQNEQNIDWFSACNFEFDRTEYNALIANCYMES